CEPHVNDIKTMAALKNGDRASPRGSRSPALTSAVPASSTGADKHEFVLKDASPAKQRLPLAGALRFPGWRRDKRPPEEQPPLRPIPPDSRAAAAVASCETGLACLFRLGVQNGVYAEIGAVRRRTLIEGE